jgi:competence protein ComEC
VGVLVTYHGFTALFTGDAEGKEREEWESHGDLPHVSVLKVAHHGAANGTDTLWLKTVQPRVAVISVGAHNRYKHPSPKTLDALTAIGATVYRTDRDGDITVTVDSLGGFAVQSDSSTTPKQWPASPATHH